MSSDISEDSSTSSLLSTSMPMIDDQLNVSATQQASSIKTVERVSLLPEKHSSQDSVNGDDEVVLWESGDKEAGMELDEWGLPPKKQTQEDKRPGSVLGAVINLCKTMVGAGILLHHLFLIVQGVFGLPYAVANVGLALGLIFVVVFGLVSMFSLLLLCACGSMVTKRWLQRGITDKKPTYDSCAKEVLIVGHMRFIFTDFPKTSCFGGHRHCY